MASSLYSNAQHVDFDSVLAMDDPGMVSMFEALMASGLRGFLGCPAVVYEDALVDFFENASVRNGVVFSTVGGQIVKISEKLFAESFELPINLSGRKNQMKMPYRLLCDIVAKAISVKAGSFNAITIEKFSLMTAVVCGVKMNWAKFLFGILKKMVAVKTKQAKGFAIQISLLLATFPAVELEITEFLSAIALEKTVLRGVQCSQDSLSVAPLVQLALEQQQSSSSSSSSSLRFDHTDVDATASYRLPISQDLSALFADFQATLSEQLFESQRNISSKLHKIEQSVRDSLSDQAAVFKSLSQEARQESRTLDDVQTIRFNEFRKKVLEQNASIFVGLADVRKEVQDVNAKVDIMASRLNDIQKDAEATKEALSHQLFEFHSQAQENHSVIHAQLSELVDYIHNSSQC
ncbi:dystroglycan-like [Dorcoceras hygrometricum]|uniref:Dystroglycan-like n=1 Tax=Dorcoceras hygrometricum TaxID=472368 RepID=A0A2Z7BFG9_9LAMI|nr:dystroglycan-like [Dorcoceras hygrometricum]